MDKKQSKKVLRTWFEQWFLNNKVTVILLNVMLCLLIIFGLNQVSYIFTPILTFINAILMPVLFAVVQYYLMNPVVNFMERKFKVPRIFTIIALLILVLVLVIWIIFTLIPIVQSQIESLLRNWPQIWETSRDTLNNLSQNPKLSSVQQTFEQYADQIQKSISSSLNESVNNFFNQIGSAVNFVSTIFITLVTAPVVLFFMLKDGEKIKQNISKVVPTKYRRSTSELLSEINQSVAAYVRGQLTVAFWVGVMFSIGYVAIGQSYGIILGVLAAVLNLIPYFGTFIALIPSLIIAVCTPPFPDMLIKVLIVFAIEQIVESRVISPMVMGNKMNMHPATTILLLIGASAVGGLFGAIVAIPVYAVTKTIVLRAFKIYSDKSGLYEQEEKVPNKSQEKESENA
ncbi:AI-2E family transporter [Holzapfeliella floricola]|uniref:Permease n=1 Tax=Holzapfeliella floricola DSM 23037 = JCM 16512 TaxID=1423744 RepID=A0A0R2DJD3_9LACO|nr:AI-2E family transporter [Holzapfeliella floricola]KRN04190.1 permease [Holzapfeliella floricola DSM 23037 = JCM 16512]